MINALRSASTGMDAQQIRIDAIANDLANVNTSGYKKTNANFEDLYYDQIKAPGTLNDKNTASPNGIQIGHGTKLTSVNKVFTEGSSQQTGNALDVSIEGAGFFKVTNSAGDIMYTRTGTLQTDKDGILVTSNGFTVEPALTIPQDAKAITIAKDGTISATTAGSETATVVGQLEVIMFQNPAGLQYAGQNVYKESDASGTPKTVVAGEEGSGTLSQGFIENSNVDIGESLIRMIVAQRSYEANAKVIEASDRMMQQANGLIG